MNYDALLQQVIEFLGTFAFAISGIRHAAAKHFDWFGGYVCGIAVAIGGGTIRDVMLGTTPFWMTNPFYIICTAFALLFVIVFARHLERLHNTCICLRHVRTCIVQYRRYSEIPCFRTAVLGCHHHGLYHGRCRWCHS